MTIGCYEHKTDFMFIMKEIEDLQEVDLKTKTMKRKMKQGASKKSRIEERKCKSRWRRQTIPENAIRMNWKTRKKRNYLSRSSNSFLKGTLMQEHQGTRHNKVIQDHDTCFQ
ncbi:hypothetical protein KI387_023907, partial [Taxus chinensis]